MMRVCVVGASGRMGRLLLGAIARSKDLTLTGAVIGPTAADSREDWGNVEPTSDPVRGMENCDLVLDFSTPAISLEVVRTASELRIPLVLGTTGHTEDQRRELEAFPSKAPLLIAPNTSIGVYALTELTRLAHSILGPDFEVEVFELHHRHKVDAPSGTARLLAASVEGALEDRSAGGARSPGSVGVASLRGGDVPGEHTVYFIGPSERIELTHRVRDRAVFADGALRLGRELLSRPAGHYRVTDILRGSLSR